MTWLAGPTTLAAVGLTAPALLLLALIGIVWLLRGLDLASVLYVAVFVCLGVLVS